MLQSSLDKHPTETIYVAWDNFTFWLTLGSLILKLLNFYIHPQIEALLDRYRKGINLLTWSTNIDLFRTASEAGLDLLKKGVLANWELFIR